MKSAEERLTFAAAQHLVAIAELRIARGYARVSDVARSLGITRGSASLTLKALKKRGFVAEDENRFLLLTDRGDSEAQDVLTKQDVLCRLLRDTVGCSEAVAERDSRALAYALSAEAAVQMARFLGSDLDAVPGGGVSDEDAAEGPERGAGPAVADGPITQR